nr:IS3 family transposase [Nocardioides jensenii]
MFPLVRELAATDAPIRVPVTVTCRVLKLARQQYYRWLNNPVTDSELVEAYRANALFDAHRDDPEFGYRFLVDEAAEDGEPMAERTAWRICSTNGWWSAFGKPKKGKAKKPGPPVHDDLCAMVDKHGVTRHVFEADAPNELWLSDITEHRTGEGKLYLCAIKDIYSNRIVGYSIDSRMKSRHAVAALNNAVARRGEVAGCIVHTDRGSQYTSLAFTEALIDAGITGSIGTVGDALDNALMESTIGLFKTEVIGHEQKIWASWRQVEEATAAWVHWFNHDRLHSAIGDVPPAELEQAHYASTRGHDNPVAA